MQIQCPSCKKQYSIDGSRVTKQGVKIICPSCKHQFIIRLKAEEKPAKPEPPKPKPDPGRTSITSPPPPPQHDPGRTRVGAAPAQVNEPAFDDFDDFDFSDLDSAGTSKSEASRSGTSKSGMTSPGKSLSGFDLGSSISGIFDPGAIPPSTPAGKPADKPAPKPAAPPQDEALTASPFEFMDDLAAANVDAGPAPPADEPGKSDDFSVPGRTASAPKGMPPRPEDSAPDFMSDPGEDEIMDFTSSEQQQFGLDGSPLAPTPAREEPQDDFDFGWEDKPKAASRLDAEMDQSKPKAPSPPAVRPLTRPDVEDTQPAKPRGAMTSVAAAVLFLAAVLAAGLIGFSGRAGQVPAPQSSFDLPAATWGGRLKAGQSSAPEAGSLPSLVVGNQSPAPATATAEENSQRAMQQALRDTAAGYEAGLAAIEAALAAEPGNGRYQAIKVDILAFREAFAAGGQAPKAGASVQALAQAGGSDPLLLRAKAHVFVNDRKTAAATALLNTYLASNQRDGVAVFLLGLATLYQPEPDREAAARLFEQAVTLEPGLARGYWELARLYRALGRYKAAIDVYNRILTAFPDHEGTADAMEETLREQQGVVAGAEPGTAVPAPAITIIPQAEAPAPPAGITASGNAISRNILEAISDVEPRLRRVTPNPAAPSLPGPGGQPGPTQPPPQPKPPEEAQ